MSLSGLIIVIASHLLRSSLKWLSDPVGKFLLNNYKFYYPFLKFIGLDKSGLM